MQRRWYNCWSSTTRAHSKVHVRQRILAVFTSTHYRKSPLVQSGMEIPCQVTAEMSLNLKNGQLLDSLIELVEVGYSEPMPPIIFGLFLADEIQVECVSNNIFKTNPLKTEKKQKRQKRQDHMTSETCFVVKMKQTRQARGLQDDCYRLIIMINEYILVLNTMSSYFFVVVVTLVEICVYRLTNCCIRFKNL